jgi:hypothetical protein
LTFTVAAAATGTGPWQTRTVSVRWYSVVVDCADVAQSRWWAQVLGWRVIYETASEVVVVPPHAADATVPGARL